MTLVMNGRLIQLTMQMGYSKNEKLILILERSHKKCCSIGESYAHAACPCVFNFNIFLACSHGFFGDGVFGHLLDLSDN